MDGYSCEVSVLWMVKAEVSVLWMVIAVRLVFCGWLRL